MEVDLALLPPGRAQRATRQVNAPHHATTLDTRQTRGLLTIPSGATPEFATSGIRHRWSLRVSLLTLTSTDGEHKVPPPAHLVAESGEYAEYETSFRGVPSLVARDADRQSRLEIVECSVPITVLPNRSKRKTTPIELYA